jgi:putative aldouronate transport system permease protein
MMVQTRSFGGIVFDFFLYVLLLFICVVTIYPFLYVLFSSFSDPVIKAQAGPILLVPQGFTTQAYERVMRTLDVWIGFRNSFIYVILGTIVCVVLTANAAYTLARNVPGRNFVMKLIAFTMFFNGGLIPTWLWIRSIGLYDTIWVMIVPLALTPWNIIIMMTYLRTIPKDVEDSARIDGANDILILFRIILPLAMPVVAVIILFHAVGIWNSYFHALIYLRNRNLVPIQVVLREILIEQSDAQYAIGASPGRDDTAAIADSVKHAVTIVAVTPIIFIYPFLQRYFVKGIMIGSLKY